MCFTKKVASIPSKLAFNLNNLSQMAENQLNTGSLDTLQKGQTLLVDARKVSGGKIQLGFAEITSRSPSLSISPIATSYVSASPRTVTKLE